MAKTSMTSRKLRAFFREPGSVAARLERRRFSLFAPRVPRGAFGYVVEDDRLGGRLLASRATLKPPRGHEAWVFRSGSWNLRLEFAELKSQEGMDLDLELELALAIEPRPVDVKLFLGSVASRERELPDRVQTGDVAALLAPGLRETFVRRVEALPVAEAVRQLDPSRARELLRESGEEVLFERGLHLSGVVSIAAKSARYEELRQSELELELEEERVRQRLRFVELWKREELEADRARREVAALRGAAGGDPADAAPAAPGAGVESAGARPQAGWRAVRLLVCAGKKVYELCPGRDEAPGAVAAFDDGELGYLRSVRVAVPEGEEGILLLAGAQQGVYTQRLVAAADSADHTEPDGMAGETAGGEAPEVYRFPEPAAGGGGTNAALLEGGRLYATHSEVGLVSWPRLSPGSPEILFSARERGVRSVRGAQVGPGGEICFAAGDAIYGWDPARGRRDFSRWGDAGSEVTSFAACRGEVVAGTSDGRLLLWRRQGEKPREIARLGRHAVYAVRPVLTEGRVHYVIGSRSSYVYVRDAAGASEMTFQATRPVRWVDASSDFLFGVDQGGCRLYLWEWSSREQPTREFLLPEKIRDLWILRGAV
jgi:hypothetical protein